VGSRSSRSKETSSGASSAMVDQTVVTCSCASRVAERLLDVLALEIGVARENLVEGGAVRDLSDDDRDRNPHPANAGAAAHDVGIKCDAIEHRPLLPAYQRSACGRKSATRFLHPS